MFRVATGNEAYHIQHSSFVVLDYNRVTVYVMKPMGAYCKKQKIIVQLCRSVKFHGPCCLSLLQLS